MPTQHPCHNSCHVSIIFSKRKPFSFPVTPPSWPLSLSTMATTASETYTKPKWSKSCHPYHRATTNRCRDHQKSIKRQTQKVHNTQTKSRSFFTHPLPFHRSHPKNQNLRKPQTRKFKSWKLIHLLLVATFPTITGPVNPISAINTPWETCNQKHRSNKTQ